MKEKNSSQLGSTAWICPKIILQISLQETTFPTVKWWYKGEEAAMQWHSSLPRARQLNTCCLERWESVHNWRVWEQKKNRVLGGNIEKAGRHGRIISRNQHPVNVMVWTVGTSDRKSPFIFVQWVKMNAGVYKKYILETSLLHWTKRNFGNMLWIL